MVDAFKTELDVGDVVLYIKNYKGRITLHKRLVTNVFKREVGLSWMQDSKIIRILVKNPSHLVYLGKAQIPDEFVEQASRVAESRGEASELQRSREASETVQPVDGVSGVV
jgi:hypothetical protein